jgi:cytochrome c-type biogenesis protein CcmF
MAYAEPAAVSQLVLLLIAFLALMHAYVTSDFSVANVAENSHSTKPLIYKMAGVWGNHEGSMLLWVLILALFGAAVAVFGNNLPPTLKARVLSVQASIAVAFLLFSLLTSNPFIRLDPAPSDGNGLNPILQDPALAFHPPFLYTGYVGFSIAFSFAIAALIEGRIDAAWARWVRPWTLAAWMFLTIGISMGSWWAYYELGWGGWWFWDPVENASLMPWLAATALLHSASVLASRDALRAWTIMLGVVAFSMSMIGTFLVRSGILTSVHAFAVDPERGTFILVLLALYIGGALTLFAVRAGTIAEGERFSILSREGALVVNNVALSAILGIVLLGTLYPLLTEAFGVRVSVGPPYFNPVGAIFFLPMLIVLAVGPMLRWRRDTFQRITAPVVAVAVVGVVVLAGVYFATGIALLPLLGMTFAAVVAVGSLLPLRGRSLRRLPVAVWGMVIAHFGVAVALFGMAADTAFQQEKLVAAQVGETIEDGPWRITLVAVEPVAGPNWTALEATLAASYKGGAAHELKPQARSFWTPPQETSESALQTRWNGQLYTVIGGEAEGGRWQLRLWWKPFVTWIWYGGGLIALGGLLALIGRLRGDLKRRSAQAQIALRRGTAAE